VYLGTQPAIGQNRKLDSIAASFNGVLTTFSLTVNTQSVVPSNVYQLFISLGGVLQDPGVDFTANGNQITFTTAPVSGLTFFGVFQGDSITGTPTIADASITTLKLATGLTITNTAGTAGAPSVTFAGDTNTGIYSPGADQVAITTGGTGRLFIDSSGRLLVGTSTARSNFFGTTLSSLTQTEGTGGSTARGSLSVINNDVSNNPPYVLLGRSGAATIGSNAAVVNGSRLGTLTFHGADGTSFIEAATVAGEVDGTPGSNDMPGRLVFSTTSDNAGSPTERMRLDSSGRLGLGTSSPGQALSVVAPSTAQAIGIWNRASDNTYAGIYFKTNDGATDQSTILNAKIGTNGAQLSFYTKPDGGSATERLTIDSSGRLGIGTTSASLGLLEVSSTNGVTLAIKNTTGTTAGTEFCQLTFNNTSNANANFESAKIKAISTNGGSNLAHLTFENSGTERARIDSSGRLLVGTSSGSKVLTINQIGGDGDGIQLIHPTRTGKWLISHSGVASENLAFIQNNGTTDNTSYVMGRNEHRISTSNVERWVIDSSGSFIGASGSAIVAPYVYSTTTATAANVNVDATGILRRSTSSIKYKTNVETIQDQYADAILGCRPVWYQSTCKADKPDWGHWGFIAEEVAAIDPRLCFFKEEEDGTLEPEGVQYDRFVPHLLNLIKRQGEAIADLQAEVTALKGA